MIYINVIFLAAFIHFVVSIENPEDFVHLLAGTFTDGNKFSTGNTLPLIGRPWGFNHWAPMSRGQNRYTGSWWFKGSDHSLTWLRCTHQPSPWIGDWGYFLFGPQISNEVDRNPEFFYEPRSATMKPHIFDATVAPHGIRIELSPTDHGSILRVTFPTNVNGQKRICFYDAQMTGQEKNNEISTIIGKSVHVSQDRMIVANFGFHFRAESADVQSIEQDQDISCFRYKRDATVVVVRIGTSLISADQAKVNLDREVPISKGFNDIALESKNIWNKLLKRVDVIDPGELSDTSTKYLTVFYTGLARALTFPRRLDEITKDGRVMHYSPYSPTGGVFEGPLVTDNGFWDTFRTVYPMLSLLYPDHLGVIIQGWLNAYKEGGWLPSWASPGYRNCMVGTYADVVVADAIIKEIKGFDLDTAREALIKDSFEEPPKYVGGAIGKEGLNEYVQKGYVPMDSIRAGEHVSRTLDFGFADFACANALEKLAELPQNSELKQILDSHVQNLRSRSQRASTSLFDSSRGLMVPKYSSGEFSPNFKDTEWGNGYTEGNAWHHSFPPYALNSLIELYHGKDNFLQKLNQILQNPSTFLVGSYGQEIHEMTEMRALALGQYGHNNQPCHHILYLFAQLGDRATTETMVRKVIDRAYGVDFFAGDEDNGEQGAWFVLSALGLYSTTPGTKDYVFGSPIFRHVRIMRGYETIPSKEKLGVSDSSVKNDQWLDIVALGTKPGIERVDEIMFNGNPINEAVISSDLLNGHGVLRFVMNNERKDGVLPDFPSKPNVASIPTTIQNKKAVENNQPDDKDIAIHHQEELITALRQEIAHNHQVVDELRRSESGGGGYHNVAEDSLFPFISVGFILLLAVVIMRRPDMLSNSNNKKMHRV